VEILFIANAVAPDRVGGLERYVRELAAALVGLGHRVTVHAKQLDPEHPRMELADDGVVIIRHGVPSRDRLAFAASYPAVSMLSALRAARAHTGAVIHAHYPIPSLGLALGRRRYLYTFHAPVYREVLAERVNSYALPRPAHPVAIATMRATERVVVRSATAITVLSEFMRGELARLDARAGRRATRIPGGVDLGKFSSAAATPSMWTASASPRLFCARRFTPRTGVGELLEAMPRIRSVFPDVQLAIAGQGRLDGQLRTLASTLGLDGSVRFLGRVSDEELAECYRSAELVIMPTQELEGFGLATVEALACGTAVLGTPAGATPEILGPLDPRLLTRDCSPAAIAEGVIAIVRDPALLAQLAQRARAHAEPFGWDAVARAYVDLYRRMAA